MKFIFIFFILLFSMGCGGSSSSTSEGGTTNSTWYTPTLGTSWQWQLSGVINTSYPVKLYDVDLFDTSTATINELHNQGKKVICYFSAGSYEDWREDKASFNSAVLGNTLDGWVGEKWLDISSSQLEPIMKSRLDLAVRKQCDGVEPDNVDGYTNNTGFALSSQDQLNYNKFLANEAHARNLSIGLKNDLDQIQELESYFDFSVNEQCHEFNECSSLAPFINHDKAVFNAEYKAVFVNNTANQRDLMCANALSEKFQTLVLPLNLDDSFRFSCN